MIYKCWNGILILILLEAVSTLDEIYHGNSEYKTLKTYHNYPKIVPLYYSDRKEISFDTEPLMLEDRNTPCTCIINSCKCYEKRTYNQGDKVCIQFENLSPNFTFQMILFKCRKDGLKELIYSGVIDTMKEAGKYIANVPHNTWLTNIKAYSIDFHKTKTYGETTIPTVDTCLHLTIIRQAISHRFYLGCLSLQNPLPREEKENIFLGEKIFDTEVATSKNDTNAASNNSTDLDISSGLFKCKKNCKSCFDVHDPSLLLNTKVCVHLYQLSEDLTLMMSIRILNNCNNTYIKQRLYALQDMKECYTIFKSNTPYKFCINFRQIKFDATPFYKLTGHLELSLRIHDFPFVTKDLGHFVVKEDKLKPVDEIEVYYYEHLNRRCTCDSNTCTCCRKLNIKRGYVSKYYCVKISNLKEDLKFRMEIAKIHTFRKVLVDTIVEKPYTWASCYWDYFKFKGKSQRYTYCIHFTNVQTVNKEIALKACIKITVGFFTKVPRTSSFACFELHGKPDKLIPPPTYIKFNAERPTKAPFTEKISFLFDPAPPLKVPKDTCNCMLDKCYCCQGVAVLDQPKLVCSSLFNHNADNQFTIKAFEINKNSKIDSIYWNNKENARPFRKCFSAKDCSPKYSYCFDFFYFDQHKDYLIGCFRISMKNHYEPTVTYPNTCFKIKRSVITDVLKPLHNEAIYTYYDQYYNSSYSSLYNSGYLKELEQDQIREINAANVRKDEEEPKEKKRRRRPKKIEEPVVDKDANNEEAEPDINSFV